ncbi:hypothetical protein EZS27_030974 [termite gut metagenome]|uniref:Uncharacterized protein n=1 Tax=termite gut metagenome TaxID=433724 RepID=A0A5J4QDA9_9ZZZZ
MKPLTGIEYEKDATGRNRYVRIDLQQYGNSELLEDLLDGLEAQACRNDKKISLEEFNHRMDNHFKKNV